MELRRRSLLAAGVAGVLVAMLPRARAQSDREIGTVERLEGTAFRRRDREMTALREESPIHAADEIVTGPGAKLQIRLYEGSLLVLGGGTSLRLSEIALPTQETPGRGLIIMGDGILRMILQGGGAWEGFSVEGSTSVASVRGTDFVVESEPEVSAVLVVSGLVQVDGKAGGSTRLSAGQGATVPRGEPAPRAKRWGAERVAETLAKVQVTP